MSGTSNRTNSRSSRRSESQGPPTFPLDEKAERALVASILLDPEQAKEQCLDLIEDEIFTHPGYRDMVKTVRELIHKGTKIDLISVQPYLHESITEVELTKIMYETVPSAASLMTHFYRVVEIYRRRAYWTLGYDLTRLSRLRDGESPLLRRRCEETIEQSEQTGSLPRIHAVADVLPRALEEIKPESERERGDVVGLGIDGLNNMLVGGLRQGHLYVLAARPSMGKTTLAWNMAANIALEEDPVMFVSLETREETLITGLLSRSSGVNSYHLMRGTYNEMAAHRLKEAAADVAQLPLYICDDSRVTMGGLRTMVRAAKSKFGIRAVFIDYLQLVTPDTSGQESRQVQVSMISRDAKLLAMEQEIPIVMLAQLSRKTEGRDNKRPMLSDLRESGSIEQDADVVALIYRPGYYDRDNDDGQTDLIVAKQRHGPCGTISLQFNAAIGDFTEKDELDQ